MALFSFGLQFKVYGYEHDVPVEEEVVAIDRDSGEEVVLAMAPRAQSIVLRSSAIAKEHSCRFRLGYDVFPSRRRRAIASLSNSWSGFARLD